jgi:hypothetical protein
MDISLAILQQELSELKRTINSLHIPPPPAYDHAPIVTWSMHNEADYRRETIRLMNKIKTPPPTAQRSIYIHCITDIAGNNYMISVFDISKKNAAIQAKLLWLDMRMPLTPIGLNRARYDAIMTFLGCNTYEYYDHILLQLLQASDIPMANDIWNNTENTERTQWLFGRFPYGFIIKEHSILTNLLHTAEMPANNIRYQLICKPIMRI